MAGHPPRGQKKFFAALTACALILALTTQTNAAGFPDTATCTATPSIDFPDTATIGREYLFLASCSTADFNAGDFVTAWIEDTGGRPIISISKYAETDAGVEWVSPLSDSSGRAWEHIYLDPQLFDCNSSGIDYNIAVSWDTKTADKQFSIVCPTITLTKYRTEVPFWETLIVTARVTDNRGYSMEGVLCYSEVLDIEGGEDANTIVIRRELVEAKTRSGGFVYFTYPTGLVSNLLQEYDYTVTIECLGGDANFQFRVEQQSSAYLRNPLYYGMIFIADNIVPIIIGIFLVAFIVGVFYMIIKGGGEE